VVNRRNDLGLSSEPAVRLAARARDALDGDAPLEQPVASFEDLAHSAGTDPSQDFVSTVEDGSNDRIRTSHGAVLAMKMLVERLPRRDTEPLTEPVRLPAVRAP
jgi:hypothetical protein